MQWGLWSVACRNQIVIHQAPSHPELIWHRFFQVTATALAHIIGIAWAGLVVFIFAEVFQILNKKSAS